MAAVVPLVPDKAREGAWGWLLLRRQCCTVATAVASHERFRTIAMTTTVLRRRTRDIIAGVAAATAVRRRQYRWGAKGWHVGIYAIALEEAVVAQMPKPTTGVAESVKPPRLSRRAHLRLMPGSFASLAPDSRSRAAVMLPQLLWLRAEQMLRWGMTAVLLINFHRVVLSPKCFF